MKEKYVGKIKVPFCVKSGEDPTVPEVFYEILSSPPKLDNRSSEYYNGCYFGVYDTGAFEYWWNIEDFGENTTVYTLEELQAIIDKVNKPSSEEVVATPDGWIPWSGGECPVPEGTLIDVKHKDGDIYRNKPAGGEYNVRWTHCGSDGDIVAYRIVDTSVASSDYDTATLDEDEYVGIASGETGSADSVGSSVKVVANISFDVVIKGQSFTLTTDEVQDLYTQLCGVENYFREWSLDV